MDNAAATPPPAIEANLKRLVSFLPVVFLRTSSCCLIIIILLFSLTALLYCIKLPFLINGIQINVAMIAIIFLTIYYLFLSKTIWIGMLFFGVLCLWICYILEQWDYLALWKIAIMLFILAWAGQFYGHKIEGKKPSFLKDLQ